MPILNPGFETVGASPGAALNWTATITFTGAVIADFSGGGALPPHPVEDFEIGWPVGMVYVTVVDPSGDPMFFDAATTPTPGRAETFEHWVGGPYLTSVSTGVAMLFGSAQLATVEGFDDGWPVEGPYVTTAAGGTSFTETFETGWNGGDTYVTTAAGGTSATFDQGSKTVEDFEAIQGDLVFVVDDTTNTCTTSVAHGLSNGFRVTTLATGRRAAGLVEGQVYQLVTASGSTFQLAKPPSSTPIDLEDAGIGRQSIHADETLFWTTT